MPDQSTTYTDHRGYVRRHVPDHSQAMDGGYVYEHRLVAEQMLGRPLEPGEVVHHRNRDKADNRPENLEVTTHAEHGRLHREAERVGKWSKTADACVVCGGTSSPCQSRNTCSACYQRERGNRLRREAGTPAKQERYASWGQWLERRQHFDACRECGQSDRRHAGRGLCIRCYNNRKYHGVPTDS